MLYETLNVLKESFEPDYFTSRVDGRIAENFSKKFELREYQKKDLGRFDFYLFTANACSINEQADRQVFFIIKKQWLNVFFTI